MFNPNWWTKHPAGHVIKEAGNFGSLMCICCGEPIYLTTVGGGLSVNLSKDDPCPKRKEWQREQDRFIGG